MAHAQDSFFFKEIGVVVRSLLVLKVAALPLVV